MRKIENNSKYAKSHEIRFKNTLDFLSDLNIESSNILNLGPDNPLSYFLKQRGYKITNTDENQDLDVDYEIVKYNKYDVVVGFEILEHLVSPFPLLKSITAKKLVISVPLSLWFAETYWNENDPYDRHYHEFEPRQLEMLLNKAGWKIIKEKKFISKSKSLGFRYFLRLIYPRYYFVYCERV